MHFFKKQSKTHFVSRGFQSSMGNTLHFGLDNQRKIDSLIIDWGMNTSQKITNLEINKKHLLNYKNAVQKKNNSDKETSLVKEIKPRDIGIDYQQNLVEKML